MLIIDPELLSNTMQSPYRNAVERGFRWLRFEGELEHQFQLFYTEGHLTRVRLAAYLGIALFGLFVFIDRTTLPAAVSLWTVSIRLGLIIPTFVAVLVVSYRQQWHVHLGWTIFAGCLVTGLGTVAVIGAALRLGAQIPYEGILLVALFIYLIACLQWWRALLTNLFTLLAFIVMEMAYQSDAQARMYQITFMFAANAVGAYGGYFLEYNARTMFLVNALLNELAELDGLTGLANRRTFNIHLERLWRQATRERSTLAVVMIDIDHFKRYNDHYGHAQGDVALRAVADVIAHHARRPMDIAARYGGEEFVLVWHQPLAQELQRMGELLVEGVRALGMPHEESEQGSLTISVGIALIAPVPGQTSADLLRAADNALYAAKHQGRNRVILTDLTLSLA